MDIKNNWLNLNRDAPQPVVLLATGRAEDGGCLPHGLPGRSSLRGCSWAWPQGARLHISPAGRGGKGTRNRIPDGRPAILRYTPSGIVAFKRPLTILRRGVSSSRVQLA